VCCSRSIITSSPTTHTCHRLAILVLGDVMSHLEKGELRTCLRRHGSPLSASITTDHIQATNISIEDWNGNLTISAIYWPPRHAIKKEQCNEFINTLGNRFLVVGDFNAKHQYWGSRLTTPKGRELYKTIKEKKIEIYPRANQRVGQQMSTELQT
jgi:hypothetical protein